MKELFIHPISKALNLKLESSDSLDGYLDQVLPKIEYSSDSLYDTTKYTNIRWIDINSSEKPQITLRIFEFLETENPQEVIQSSKYTHSINGNVSYGQWTLLKGKALVLEHDISKELYDLCFLNDHFMVLKKHGHRPNSNMSKYIFLGREELVDNLSWKQATDELYNVYRYNLASIVLVAILAFVVLLVGILSFV